MSLKASHGVFRCGVVLCTTNGKSDLPVILLDCSLNLNDEKRLLCTANQENLMMVHVNRPTQTSQLLHPFETTVDRKMSANMTDSSIVAAYQGNLVANYGIFASLTMVSFEFMITIRDEYEFIWQRKWTAATWLFLANRYVMLASVLAAAMPYTARDTSLQYFITVLYEMPAFILAIFSGLRVFALLGRAYIPAAITLTLALASIALIFYQTSRTSNYYVDDPVLGPSCYGSYHISASVWFYEKYVNRNEYDTDYLTANLASVLCTIAADVIVIAVTWIKIYRHVRQASSAGISVGFSTTFLKYGTLYFIVIFAVNLTSGLILLVPALQLTSIIGIFTFSLPSVVLSRFLISLRQAEATKTSEITRFSQISVPHFHAPSNPAIIGNLGEPLMDAEEDIIDGERVDAPLHHGDSDEASSDALDSERGKAQVPRDLS
ncbi:hypothetical protein NM688_g5595 [Phlebia brevispora]|uniref:Uncharacterized protein n=1 Tax=Phlebia brevispora TaxID=194682 RepID=A0ACC1ST16_9APHY|nr:hypothetical protein NM688_g5595 [Phlebia brevispora]